MPVTKSGGFQMNPQVGAMHDTPPPAADPAAAAPVSITLTKNPDGTITCDDGSGQPSIHNSVQDALADANLKLGGEAPAGAADAGDAGTGTDADDQY